MAGKTTVVACAAFAAAALIAASGSAKTICGGLVREFKYDAPNRAPVHFGGWSRAEGAEGHDYCVFADVFYADGSALWAQKADFTWQRLYNLPHEPRVCEIMDDFPRITPEQFKGDVFPSGVTSLVYHVSLRNLPYRPLGAFIAAIAAGQQPVFSVAGE